MPRDITNAMVEIIMISNITQKTGITWSASDFGDAPSTIRHSNSPSQLMNDTPNNIYSNIFISYSSPKTLLILSTQKEYPTMLS
jgi:hypothetical protein